jgi:hypothetical protein
MNKQKQILKTEKKEFKPKPWLRKPDEEKKIQGYYYIKNKYKNIAEEKVNDIINYLNNKI